MPTKLRIIAQAVNIDGQGNEEINSSVSLMKQFHPNFTIQVDVDMPTQDSAISLTER